MEPRGWCGDGPTCFACENGLVPGPILVIPHLLARVCPCLEDVGREGRQPYPLEYQMGGLMDGFAGRGGWESSPAPGLIAARSVDGQLDGEGPGTIQDINNDARADSFPAQEHSPGMCTLIGVQEKPLDASDGVGAHADKPGADDPRCVQDKDVALAQEIGKVGDSAMLAFARGGPAHDQEARGIAWFRRVGSDSPGWQVVFKIRSPQQP